MPMPVGKSVWRRHFRGHFSALQLKIEKMLEKSGVLVAIIIR